MAKKSKASSGKTVASALLELLGVAIEEGAVTSAEVSAVIGSSGTPSKSKKKKDEEEEEEEEEEEDSDEDEEEEEEVPDFDEMNLKEMKKFCKDNEIEIPKKAKTEDALREFLQEEFASDEDEDEEEEEEDDAPDFDEMNLKELKKFAKDNDIEVPKKVKSEDDLREFLQENYSSDEDEDEEEEEEDDAPDFDEMDLKELKKFVKDNDLEVPAKYLKTEDKLRGWLEENYSSDEDEDEDEEEEEWSEEE
jgi:hypothetical protein